VFVLGGVTVQDASSEDKHSTLGPYIKQIRCSQTVSSHAPPVGMIYLDSQTRG
jgi:hypothetical protein